MPPPPGAQPAPTRCDRASGGSTTAVTAALTMHYVHLALSEPAFADMSVHRITKVVRRFLAAGLHEREFLQYVVGYADPTGESAVRNVMRAGGR